VPVLFVLEFGLDAIFTLFAQIVALEVVNNRDVINVLLFIDLIDVLRCKNMAHDVFARREYCFDSSWNFFDTHE
jgi:hypothetical protein